MIIIYIDIFTQNVRIHGIMYFINFCTIYRKSHGATCPVFPELSKYTYESAFHSVCVCVCVLSIRLSVLGSISPVLPRFSPRLTEIEV